jgi:hypothetical protein
MTATVTPVPVAAASALPDSSTPETTFDAMFQAFLSWLSTSAQPGFNALADASYANALVAEAAALVKNTDTFKGIYAGGTTYAVGDSVIHGGVYWLGNTAGNVGNTPADGSAYWSRVYDFSSRAQVHAAILSM